MLPHRRSVADLDWANLQDPIFEEMTLQGHVCVDGDILPNPNQVSLGEIGRLYEGPSTNPRAEEPQYRIHVAGANEGVGEDRESKIVKCYEVSFRSPNERAPEGFDPWLVFPYEDSLRDPTEQESDEGTYKIEKWERDERELNRGLHPYFVKAFDQYGCDDQVTETGQNDSEQFMKQSVEVLFAAWSIGFPHIELT